MSKPESRSFLSEMSLSVGFSCVGGGSCAGGGMLPICCRGMPPNCCGSPWMGLMSYANELELVMEDLELLLDVDRPRS